MVQAHIVVQLEGAAQPLGPPHVAIMVHMAPAKGGVAPDLSGLGETVGRGAGNLCGRTRIIKLEHLGFTPGIGGVIRDVHGNIADNANAALVGVALELAPLAVKTILREGVIACALPIGGIVEDRDVIAR